MRALDRRLRILAERFTPRIDQRTVALAEIIRERRRRRLELSGEEFVEPAVPAAPGFGRVLTISETLRLKRRSG